MTRAGGVFVSSLPFPYLWSTGCKGKIPCIAGAGESRPKFPPRHEIFAASGLFLAPSGSPPRTFPLADQRLVNFMLFYEVFPHGRITYFSLAWVILCRKRSSDEMKRDLFIRA